MRHIRAGHKACRGARTWTSVEVSTRGRPVYEDGSVDGLSTRQGLAAPPGSSTWSTSTEVVTVDLEGDRLVGRDREPVDVVSVDHVGPLGRVGPASKSLAGDPQRAGEPDISQGEEVEARGRRRRQGAGRPGARPR